MESESRRARELRFSVVVVVVGESGRPSIGAGGKGSGMASLPLDGDAEWPRALPLPCEPTE